ncbi:MAG: hypothetical protein RRY10_05175 [Christensenellaceae bacterium]
MSEIVKLQFPAKKEYIKAIRLAVSGIACNIDYNVDEIEDIKSCVAEACILFLCGQMCAGLHINIKSSDQLEIRVRAQKAECSLCDGQDCTGFSEEISKLMIQSLSDQSEFVEEDGILKEIYFVKKPA